MGGHRIMTTVHTLESEIHFYAGVKLDPEEEKIFIPQPPQDWNKETGKISDYWTRENFEKEALEPYEQTELLISPSSYQNIGKQIYPPYELSKFQLTNVNFVKIINRDEKREKIFYGFINSVSYDNDGKTIVDWNVSEFYTNIFNALDFANSEINQAHIPLSKSDNSEIVDYKNYRNKEALSSGSYLQEAEVTEILPPDKRNVRFLAIEYYLAAEKDEAISGGGIGIGLPSQRPFLILPFNNSTFECYDVHVGGSPVSQGLAGANAAKVFFDLALKGAELENDGNAIGQNGVVYWIDIPFEVNGNIINFNEGDSVWYTKSASSMTHKLPLLASNINGIPLKVNFTNGQDLYKHAFDILRWQIDQYGIRDSLKRFGFVPEKATHYIGFNFFDSDKNIGSYSLDETSDVFTNGMEIEIHSSPVQASRTDITVVPFVKGEDTSGGKMTRVVRKLVSSRSASVPLANNTYKTQSFLQQNSMRNSKDVIDATADMTRQQNKFNNDQAHVQAQNNTKEANLRNSQNLHMTTQTANQQQGMNQAQIGIAAGINTASGLTSGGIKGAIGGAAGSAISGGAQWALAQSQHNNSMANMGLQNVQNTNMTNMQNSNSLALANNTLSFSDKIAAQTQQMQLGTLYAGWNDMKLQPATVVSGGSESEYIYHQNWDGLRIITTFPTAYQLFNIIRILAMYGSSVAEYGNPQKYMFNMTTVDYVKTENCHIKPSSKIENSVRIMLETMFDRGVQIWHDLDAMANNDYSQNNYIGHTNNTLV